MLTLQCPQCGEEKVTPQPHGDLWICGHCGYDIRFMNESFRLLMLARLKADHVSCPVCKRDTYVEPANAHPEFDWFCKRCEKWFMVDKIEIISKGESTCQLEE